MDSGELEPSTGIGDEDRLDIPIDPYWEFMSRFHYLVRQARNMANDHAVSYREFHVGAALFGLVGDDPEPEIITGANVKPNKESPKYCAEMDVIDQAEEVGITKTVGIIIAGTSKAREIRSVSDILTPTLHPCKPCRDKLKLSKITDNDTMIVTVPLETDVIRFEVFTPEDLEVFYAAEEQRDTRFTAPRHSLNSEVWGRRLDLYAQTMATNELLDPARVAMMALTAVIDR